MRNRLCDRAETVVMILTLAAFALITLTGFFVTCDVEIFYTPDNNEHVIFLPDRPLLLLALVAVALALFAAILRRPVTERIVRVAAVGMLTVTTLLGLWWVFAAKAVPYADSANVLDVARALAQNQFGALQTSEYFHRLIHQLGFLRYAELAARLVGPENLNAVLGVANVLYVDATYLALLCIAHSLFRDRRVELITALLLALCLQPVFLCTFLYGLLPGLACGLWSTYFVIRCLRTEKLWPLLPAAALLALSVLLKQNNKILLIADGIVLLLHALRQKRWRYAACAAAMAACALLLPLLVQRDYEKRADTDFGRGTPLTAWLVTGFSESMFCSGWYDSYPYFVLADNGYDTEAAAVQIRGDFLAALQKFRGRPRYLAVFFYHKLTSQWNEPAYQCIWSSAAGLEFSAKRSELVESLSYGAGNKALRAYWNVFTQTVYVGFVVSLVFLLREKERRDELLLLPLTVLGIFLYHALFEAKAQYALTPYLMLFPYAAWGVVRMIESITNVLRTRIGNTQERRIGETQGPKQESTEL